MHGYLAPWRRAHSEPGTPSSWRCRVPGMPPPTPSATSDCASTTTRTRNWPAPSRGRAAPALAEPMRP